MIPRALALIGGTPLRLLSTLIVISVVAPAMRALGLPPLVTVAVVIIVLVPPGLCILVLLAATVDDRRRRRRD